MRQLTTLSMIEKDNKVLLAMKKRGFGVGWWNGYGGKISEGETTEEAAARELKEESGIIVKLQKERGVIEFYFQGTDKIIEMHIFEVTKYEGEPIETEEMKPQWFFKDKIPYEKMWSGDREWIPLYLQGKYFEGRITYDAEGKNILDTEIRTVDKEIKPETENFREGAMKFKIDQKIIEKYSGLNLGVVAVKGIDNNGGDNKIIEMLRQEEKRIKGNFQKETLGQEPKIDVWRKAYSSFGAKPKKYRSSVENLYKMVLDGVELRHINKLVDIYNFVSLKYMLPAGGEDLEKIKGDISLTFAGENEPKIIQLGEKEAKAPHPGEVIYKDEISAICRRWNWREADRTKLTEKTTSTILVIEGLSPVTIDEISIATNELSNLVKKYCGGENKIRILNGDNNEIEV